MYETETEVFDINANDKMKKYPKIQSIFKRDKNNKFIEGEFSIPEFAYLQNNLWEMCEKIHGTNIRVIWSPYPNVMIPKIPAEDTVYFRGRTNGGSIPSFLYDKLKELFPVSKFQKLYPKQPMILFGEGYGAKIIKGSGNYIPDGVSFILFDVFTEGEDQWWWLERHNIEDVAKKMKIDVVPVIARGTLWSAIDLIKKGVQSTFGNFPAEGLVLKPMVRLMQANGDPIITKIKHEDFKVEPNEDEELEGASQSEPQQAEGVQK